jgi:hypothetical protein
MRIAYLLIPCSIFVIGCGGSSPGQLGRAQFAWNVCVTGCSLDENPLASGGAHDEIAVTLAPGYIVAGVRSSNPKVATFTLDDPQVVDVISGAPGTTTLTLLDGNGATIDDVALDVVATAALVADAPPPWGSGAAVLLAGTAMPFHVTTEDAKNHMLRGTGGVRFTTNGAVQSTPGITIGDEVYLTGNEGTGSVIAAAGNVSLSQSLTIVAAAHVTGLVATAETGVAQSGGGFSQTVDVVANSAGGAIYGAACAWTASDPSVVVGGTTTRVLDGKPTQSTAFLLGQPGTFSATCTVGAQTVTAQLTR